MQCIFFQQRKCFQSIVSQRRKCFQSIFSQQRKYFHQSICRLPDDHHAFDHAFGGGNWNDAVLLLAVVYAPMSWMPVCSCSVRTIQHGMAEAAKMSEHVGKVICGDRSRKLYEYLVRLNVDYWLSYWFTGILLYSTVASRNEQ